MFEWVLKRGWRGRRQRAGLVESEEIDLELRLLMHIGSEWSVEDLLDVVGLDEYALVGRTRKIFTSIHGAVVPTGGEVGELDAVPISVGKFSQTVIDDQAAAISG